jgi:thioredoxin reductase (NADPH)
VSSNESTETGTDTATNGGSEAVHNAIVIGSGPAGYTAAIYLARANLAPLVFEGAVTAGGALMNTTDVENFPGFPDGIMGPELMESLRKQAERFGATLVTDDVTEVDLTADPKVVRVGSDTYHAKTVVLAMGSAYRELGVPGEKELSGHGVSWCATCDGFFFRDQDIAVVGGGDSAMEEATFLTRFARKVYVVHRRDTLRASKIMQERAFDNPKIEFVWDTEVVEAVGEGKLAGVRVRNLKTGEQSTLDVTGLFIAVGHDPRSELVRGQVDLDPEGYVRTSGGTTHTNLRGVFAAGDLVDHTYRQAITAAGTGCMAALDAERFLAATEGETSTDAGAGWTTADQGHPGDHPETSDDPRRGSSLV